MSVERTYWGDFDPTQHYTKMNKTKIKCEPDFNYMIPPPDDAVWINHLGTVVMNKLTFEKLTGKAILEPGEAIIPIGRRECTQTEK